MPDVDPAVTKCKTNETALQWNETGPQGPMGPAGPVVSARNGMIADFGWHATSLIVDLLAGDQQQKAGDFTFAIFCP